jgi:hypothetical protein
MVYGYWNMLEAYGLTFWYMVDAKYGIGVSTWYDTGYGTWLMYDMV